MVYFEYCNSSNGDTWASEIGILSKDLPILITTFKKVPRGTNGGISTLGLLASMCGGLFIGIIAGLPSILFLDCSIRYHNAFLILCIGGISGLIGSLIDSLLGTFSTLLSI